MQGKLFFSELGDAHKAIDKITAIHSGVEKSRDAKIPDWAYRDVLFMLIHYSIASFELLERKLNEKEKNDLFDVFYRMGTRMKLTGLPANYNEWLVMHDKQLQEDLQKSHYTIDLYKQYKKHLGSFRYALVLESQRLVVPLKVNELLNLGNVKWLHILLPFYKLSRKLKLDGIIKSLLVPTAYRLQVTALDIVKQ